MAQLQPGDPWHVGPYEVIARLTADEGAASIGRLYLAQYPAAGQVAMRVIAPRLAADDALRGGISDGVVAARAVTSPRVVPLRAAAILKERAPWIAWEYTPGPSLAAVLANRGRLPEAAIAGLAAGLAEALRAIHDAGAVHGDLRPATIFLAGGKPRVTGHGVAAAVQAAARLDGAASPVVPDAAGQGSDPRFFIAPELASGTVIDPAGDMFSLGAVVAFAAGGTGPFGIGGPAGSPYHAPYGIPDLGGTPVALQPLITRCLDADPGWRPTAGEFLSLVIALFPDAAQPTTWPQVDAPQQATRQATRATPAGHWAPAYGPAHAAGPWPRLKSWIQIGWVIAILALAVTGLAGNGLHRTTPARVSTAPLTPVTPVTGASPSPAPAATSPAEQPAGQFLLYPVYQAGDCLYGNDLPNKGGGPWPFSTWKVPCDQPHADEVFYANDAYWPAGAAYPGDEAVQDQARTRCDRQFTAYAGVPASQTPFAYRSLAPSSGSWQEGDRELACVAYDTTTYRPALKASIRHSR